MKEGGNVNCQVNSVANSKFYITDNNFQPEYFIQMRDYKCLTVLGCEFDNQSYQVIITKGILMFGLLAERLVLEASEYVNPFNGQNSTKLLTPKRNSFTNLEMGIFLNGDPVGSSFDAIIKNCDFTKVALGIKVILTSSVSISCCKYDAVIYESNTPIFNELPLMAQITLDAQGNPITPSPTTAQKFTSYSIFVLCEDIHNDVSIRDNECSWNNDFQTKQAHGVVLFPPRSMSAGEYHIFNNIFEFTGSEGGEVTGIFIHGDYTSHLEPQLNEFIGLDKDIHLAGLLKLHGSSCYNAILSAQGERDNGMGGSYYICPGNIFSDPASNSQGNIFSDATVVYHSYAIINGPPKREPTQLSTCVSAVYTGNVFTPIAKICSVPPVSGLLSAKKPAAETEGCLSIHPNPAVDIVHIGFENEKFATADNKQLTIYNSMMQVMYVATLEREQTFTITDVSNLPPGLYIVVLTANGYDRCINKLIKQ
jgi:hypothetical protein